MIHCTTPTNRLRLDLPPDVLGFALCEGVDIWALVACLGVVYPVGAATLAATFGEVVASNAPGGMRRFLLLTISKLTGSLIGGV